MILFMDKIEVYIYGDKLTFCYPGELDHTTWSCYPTFNLEVEDFLNLMTPIMESHSWITPRDLQERACKAGFATYSRQ